MAAQNKEDKNEVLEGELTAFLGGNELADKYLAKGNELKALQSFLADHLQSFRVVEPNKLQLQFKRPMEPKEFAALDKLMKPILKKNLSTRYQMIYVVRTAFFVDLDKAGDAEQLARELRSVQVLGKSRGLTRPEKAEMHSPLDEQSAQDAKNTLHDNCVEITTADSGSITFALEKSVSENAAETVDQYLLSFIPKGSVKTDHKDKQVFKYILRPEAVGSVDPNDIVIAVRKDLAVPEPVRVARPVAKEDCKPG